MIDLLRETTAVFSDDRTYRYVLTRQWDPARRSLAFVMLNPSTADEWANDPTVERCERRAHLMGYGGLIVLNLFAYRATQPQAMLAHRDPVGSDNDAHIARILNGWPGARPDVVCAWGTHGRHRGRDRAVTKLILRARIQPMVLGVTKDGFPRHPLYVPYQTLPRPWTYEELDDYLSD